jgi:hypothetical protein
VLILRLAVASGADDAPARRPWPPGASLRSPPATAHLSAALQPTGRAPDAWVMRNVVLSGVTVVFGLVLLLGYLTIRLAARMALAMAPADRPLP